MVDVGVLEVPKVVLASGSPRRAAILRTFGIEPTVMPTDVDESIAPGEAASHLVDRLARSKMSAAVDRLVPANRPTLVIAADTVVDVNGSIMGKPEGKADAERMLAILSGGTHQVVTGMAVAMITSEHDVNDRMVVSGQTVTSVSFRELDQELLDWYVATGEASDKAGAYGIQGRGGLLVAGIEGSYLNVVGLPIVTLDELCGRLGWPLHRLATAADGRPQGRSVGENPGVRL